MIGTVETLAALAVLVLAVALTLARSPEAAIDLLAWAAVPQSVLAAVLAGWGGLPLLYPDALAILIVKGWWAPRVLGRGVRQPEASYGQRSTLSATAILLAAALVTLICLRLAVAILPLRATALGLSLAAMCVGFGGVALRSELWSQGAGMLMGEAGIMTMILVLAAGLPPLGETLALAEVVLLALLLAALTRLVQALHGAPDSSFLRGLRG